MSEMVISRELKSPEKLIGLAGAIAELSLSVWHGLEAVNEWQPFTASPR